jgi:hypothetical protein
VRLICDLGAKVLDAALVEAMCAIFQPGIDQPVFAFRLVRTPVDEKALSLRYAVSTCAIGDDSPLVFSPSLEDLRKIDGSPLVYSAAKEFAALQTCGARLGSDLAYVEQGLSTKDDFRYLRLWWELRHDALANEWSWIAKGGEYRPFYSDLRLLVRSYGQFRELDADLCRKYTYLKGNSDWVLHPESHYLAGGMTYPERTTSAFGPRLLPCAAYFSHVGLGVIPRDETISPVSLCGLLMTRPVQLQVELQVGSADAVESGSAARHYSIAAVSSIRIPSSVRFIDIEDNVAEVAGAAYLDCQNQETSPLFRGMRWIDGGADLSAYIRLYFERHETRCLRALYAWGVIERNVESAFGIHQDLLDDEVGCRASSYPHKEVNSEEVRTLLDLSLDALVDATVKRRGPHRIFSKKAYIVDRRLELICANLSAHPEDVVSASQVAQCVPKEFADGIRKQLLSYLVGRAFGRFSAVSPCDVAQSTWPNLHELTAPLNVVSPAMVTLGATDDDPVSRRAGGGILVDDAGHSEDLLAMCRMMMEEMGFSFGEWHQLWEGLCKNEDDARSFLAREFFPDHVARYTDFRRKAPIYWQLATPSGRYSVWLYVHLFTKDTLFRVQHEYARPKLLHEERRLESMRHEFGDNPSAAQRKNIATQEGFVEELRGFLEEVQRVAPIWNPNLDDGVIINFAPLWRLVPQNKSWQKELKGIWDALCAGEFDWAHLAMHLWPERVVPKCAKDHSLAIAHGLEEVFWQENGGGKWVARETPTRSVDERIRERTSPAVKAALDSLLQAPVAQNGRSRSKVRRASIGSA